jgi:hypothetical protein
VPDSFAALARDYLIKHGWAERSSGQEESRWAPPGHETGVLFHVSVTQGIAPGSSCWSWLVGQIADREGRSPAVVAAEILDPGQDPPPLQAVHGYQWIRLDGTDAEVLAERPVRLCARPARTGRGTPGEATGQAG